MGIKVARTLMATIFSLFLITGNAAVNASTTQHSKTKPVLKKTVVINPNTYVYGPNDSRFRTKENAEEIYRMNGTYESLANLYSNTSSDTGTGVVDDDTSTSNMHDEDTDISNNQNNGYNNNLDNGITSQELQSNLESNVGMAMQYDVRQYNGIRECINLFSTVDGKVVKNDSFFACQRYKAR